MALKQLPNNLEAEESVLGACFLSTNALNIAVENLDAQDFFDQRHAQIFQALKNLCEQKVPVDLTTITSELTKQNVLSSVGGVEYLSEIIQFVPTAANIEYYVKEVNETALLRRLIETATEIANIGYNNEESVYDTLDKAEQRILTIAKSRKSSEFKTIQDVLLKTQDDLEKLAEQKGEITGIATGWYDFDKLTAGLHEN